MIKKIITVESKDAELLSTRCSHVNTIKDVRLARKLERDLLDTANNNYGECLGLAANQIGSQLRAFAFRAPGGKFLVVFNPEIIGQSGGMKRMPESCLSRVDAKGFRLPPIEVRRPKCITVEVLHLMPKGYASQKDDHMCGAFRLERFALKNLEARVFMHELDHLNGVII